MIKEKKKWGTFKRLFSKESSKPSSKSGEPQEEGFVIDESEIEKSVIEESVNDFIIEESTNDVFVINPTPKDYRTLGVDEEDSDGEIKKKYRTLIKQHHPDYGGDPKKFMKIKKAYEKIMKYRA